MPALASLNRALARKRQSATAPKDAAGKSKTSVVPQEFQGHLQISEEFLKPHDVNLPTVLKFCVQILRQNWGKKLYFMWHKT